MIVFAEGGVSIDDRGYKLDVRGPGILDAREVRDLRDALTEWLQQVGRDE